MKDWYPFELHTHTPHSDGKHSLMEMAQKAKELGFTGIALTDHNTMSGLIDKDEVEKRTGLHIIRGLEWTTFYGHMLTLGMEEYEDWRDLSPLDIHKGIDRIHKQGGLAGVAHPFNIGSPICTGCFWDYEISDWNDIDFIEVWSETFPPMAEKNIRAFDLWTDKLNEGYRIPATSGRDWHESTPDDGPIAVTYFHTKDTNEVSVMNALKGGHISISMGPLLTYSVRKNQTGETFIPGDEIDLNESNKEIEVTTTVDATKGLGTGEIPEQTFELRISSNQGILKSLSIESSYDKKSCNLVTDGSFWLRAELYGVINNKETMIAFTNPIYFNQ